MAQKERLPAWLSVKCINGCQLRVAKTITNQGYGDSTVMSLHTLWKLAAMNAPLG